MPAGSAPAHAVITGTWFGPVATTTLAASSTPSEVSRRNLPPGPGGARSASTRTPVRTGAAIAAA